MTMPMTGNKKHQVR